MHITAQGSRLRNDLYCVDWDVKLYCTIPGQSIVCCLLLLLLLRYVYVPSVPWHCWLSDRKGIPLVNNRTLVISDILFLKTFWVCPKLLENRPVKQKPTVVVFKVCLCSLYQWRPQWSVTAVHRSTSHPPRTLQPRLGAPFQAFETCSSSMSRDTFVPLGIRSSVSIVFPRRLPPVSSIICCTSVFFGRKLWMRSFRGEWKQFVGSSLDLDLLCFLLWHFYAVHWMTERTAGL